MSSKNKILQNIQKFQNKEELDIQTNFSHHTDILDQFIANASLAGAKVSLSDKNSCDDKLMELTKELDDFFIYESSLGVAENGALWCHNLSTDRKKLFLTNDLIIIIKKENLVANMHQAYEKISFDNGAFGTFIAGPSKTADIEQSLVLGAHGAMGLDIIVINS